MGYNLLPAEGPHAGSRLLGADEQTARNLDRGVARASRLFGGTFEDPEAAFRRALGEDGAAHLESYLRSGPS